MAKAAYFGAVAGHLLHLPPLPGKGCGFSSLPNSLHIWVTTLPARRSYRKLKVFMIFISDGYGGGGAGRVTQRGERHHSIFPRDCRTMVSRSRGLGPEFWEGICRKYHCASTATLQSSPMNRAT